MAITSTTSLSFGWRMQERLEAIYIYILPPFVFTCHQTFTVAILTICFFSAKDF